MKINYKHITLESLASYSQNEIYVSILRLDKVHPIVSGNKWFKLKHYVEEALAQKNSTIASFGGAYSNHIVALAYTCREMGLSSIGFIRGEPSDSISMKDAANAGMQIEYISRQNFSNKLALKNKYAHPNWYWVNEGGYGMNGAKGASDIYTTADLSEFTHIICAVGTGTMMAGLVEAAGLQQQIIGINVLKNNFSIEAEIRSLLKDKNDPLTILNDYHFGGYAKSSPALLNFMNELYLKEGLATDFVYTGKLLFALDDLLQKKYFGEHAKVLVVHSGGLQGNRSLPLGTLVF